LMITMSGDMIKWESEIYKAKAEQYHLWGGYGGY